MSQVQPFFSAGHWRPGDRTMLAIAAFGGPYVLNWIDLEAPSQEEGIGWGVVARAGDSQGPAMAAWSHSGDRIAYTSGSVTAGDIYTVPYNDRQGGIATPLSGASDPSLNEFYPAYSPDGALVAFNRVPRGQTSDNNQASEVFIIPAAGGTPIRLDANDPPACSGMLSPSLANSWPKWAPRVSEFVGRKCYWIAFSSLRADWIPQLFIAGVVIENGRVKTYYGAARRLARAVAFSLDGKTRKIFPKRDFTVAGCRENKNLPLALSKVTRQRPRGSASALKTALAPSKLGPLLIGTYRATQPSGGRASQRRQKQIAHQGGGGRLSWCKPLTRRAVPSCSPHERRTAHSQEMIHEARSFLVPRRRIAGVWRRRARPSPAAAE
jgi:hypothetical protein